MIFVHIRESYQGELVRELFEVGSDEGVTLCLHPSFLIHGSTKQQQMRGVRDLVRNHGLLWIKADGEEWIIDLESFLAQNFAADIRSKGWVWLDGTVTMRPELQNMPTTHDQMRLHLSERNIETVAAVFDLTLESVQQHRIRSQKPDFSYEDAITAVKDDSYLEVSEDVLRRLLKACMDIHGSNPVALHRINHAAEIVRLELARRNSLREPASPPFGSAAGVSKSAPPVQKLVFISHTHDDQGLAEAVLDLLCTALHLRRSDFVCTSVEGAQLRGGDEPDIVLREQVRHVPAFLSLLTPKALRSNYVLFELGARWGCDGHHIPLLAKGSGDDVIKAPLKKIGLHLTKEKDIYRLVETLGAVLNREMQPTSSYHSKMMTVVSIANAIVPDAQFLAQNLPTTPNQITVSADAQRLLREIATTKFGTARVVVAQGREIIRIDGSANQDFLGKMDNPRDEARWHHALNELIRLDFLKRDLNRSVKVTHTGFDFANRMTGGE